MTPVAVGRVFAGLAVHSAAKKLMRRPVPGKLLKPSLSGNPIATLPLGTAFPCLWPVINDGPRIVFSISSRRRHSRAAQGASRFSTLPMRIGLVR